MKVLQIVTRPLRHKAGVGDKGNGTRVFRSRNIAPQT